MSSFGFTGRVKNGFLGPPPPLDAEFDDVCSFNLARLDMKPDTTLSRFAMIIKNSFFGVIFVVVTIVEM